MTTEITITKENTSNGGFFEAIIAAYGKLTNNPLALFLFCVALLAIVAESNSKLGPVEILKNTLEEYVEDLDHPAFLRTIASVFLGICNFIIKTQPKFYLVILVLIIPIVYSLDSPFLFLLLLFYVCVSTHATWTLFLITQVLFVYYNMPSNFDRIILFIIFIYLIFGTDNINNMFASVANQNHSSSG